MLVYWRSPIFATYEQNGTNTNLTEQHLYSSARLGMRQTNLLVKNTAGIISLNPNQRVFYRSVGHKAYEQTNHLGDVLVTLSDKVLNQGGYYQAIVKNASLTYPFGWAIPERTYTSALGEYRFGFNGVEENPEIGEGHTTTFYREMDNRIARWWSTDPRPNASVSQYAMMENNPIQFSDALGDTIIWGENVNQELMNAVSDLRQSSEIFENIYQALYTDCKTYVVSVQSSQGNMLKGNGGRLVPAELQQDGTMKGLIIISDDALKVQEDLLPTISEEFFHAYQDVFYDGLDYKLPNKRTIPEWEAEAKFLVGNIQIQKDLSEGKEIDVSAVFKTKEDVKLNDQFEFYVGFLDVGKEGQGLAKYMYQLNSNTIKPIKGSDVSEYYNLYLKRFKEIGTYEGAQRTLEPEASNSLLTK